MKKFLINKNKSIGHVLFIVEGGKTEFIILHRIFTKIFDYQYERITRTKPYHKYNSKVNPHSRVMVINTEESNIRDINEENDYLNELFESLIDDYKLDIANTAVYYIFDRDIESNTDPEFIRKLINDLRNSRDNDNYYMQGMFLLSYPAIEAFTLSNFDDESYKKSFKLGSELKQYLHESKLNQDKINEETLISSCGQMENALNSIGINEYNLDDFYEANIGVFDNEEEFYKDNEKYKVLSLICIALLDLQLLEIEE